MATQSSASWVGSHRGTVIRIAVAVVVVLALIVAGVIFYMQRSEAAESSLGTALDVYSSALAQPGAPAGKGVYNTASERAKAANTQFVAVANQYGWLPEGAKAHYFAGLSYQDMGQTGSAETELKKAAGAWDSNLSSLAKFALGSFYRQNGRNPQAIEQYNGLIAKPTVAVPVYTSQLALADLYSAAGQKDQAKQLWAKIKDADKSGAAGSIAAQKLNGK